MHGSSQRKVRSVFLYALAVVVLLGAGSATYRLSVNLREPPVAWCDINDAACRNVCTKKPITITYFHAKWCPACKTFDETTLSDGRVRARLASYGTISADIDTAKEFANQAHVTAIPTIIAHDGCEEIMRVKGALDIGSFLGFLDAIEKIAAEN